MPASSPFRIGNINVTTLSDGYLDIPQGFFPEAPVRNLPAKNAPIRFGANSWLVEIEGRRILIDAGSGTFLRQRYPETGQLHLKLTSRDIAPDTISDIIVTHMHADHIGGLVQDGQSAFPNANIHINAIEWTYWTDPALLENAPEDRKPLVTLIQTISRPITSQVRLWQDELLLADGLTLFATPGHTPGHSSVEISQGSEKLMILGDVLVSEALQIRDPSIIYALDTDPNIAVRTRKSLFDRLAKDNIPFMATHTTFQGPARLAAAGQGYIMKREAG